MFANSWKSFWPIGWFIVCMGALFMLDDFKSRPGKEIPTNNPVAQPTEPQGPLHVVMYLHPRCPCSNASLQELAKLLETSPQKPKVEIVISPRELYSPHAPLVVLAKSIPGVSVRTLNDSDNLQSVGATTSGHVVVFDEVGHELFRGGLTRARGHEGSSEGNRAVADLLSGKKNAITATAVFGCALTDTSSSSGGTINGTNR